MARRWVPPALLPSDSGDETSPRFGSYEEALRAHGSAYDIQLLSEVVAAKTRVASERLGQTPSDLDSGSLSILNALAVVGSAAPLRVIDFGGAAGYHYFVAKSLCPQLVDVEWHVVETEAMVRAASGLKTAELAFYPDVAAAVATWDTPPDLVFASGVFQYLPDPMSSLRELIATRARVVFISRTALAAGATAVVTVQKAQLSGNGPGPMPDSIPDQTLTYPVTFASRSEFESELAVDYTITTRVREGHDIHHVAGVSIDSVGYACVRKA